MMTRKLSERRRTKQKRKLEAQFARLIDQMRAMGETAGAFAEVSRLPGQTFTAAQIEKGAQAFVGEEVAGIAAPFAGLQIAGVAVSLAIDEAALRSAFCDGFRSAVSSDALAVDGAGVAWDAATVDAFALFIADAMARGCQLGRLFTAAEIDKAVETACAPCEREGPYSDLAEGMPPDIREAAASIGPVVFRARMRRGLLAALPPSIIAAEGHA